MYGPKLPQSLDKLQPERRAVYPKSAESTPELPVFAVGFRSCMSHVMRADEQPRAQNPLFKVRANPPPTVARKEPETYELPDMPEGLSNEQRKMLAESMRGSVFNLMGSGCDMSDFHEDDEQEPVATDKPSGPDRRHNFFTGFHEELVPQPD